jgi:hypothetical protein
MIPGVTRTMLSLKTTIGLIAALAVIATASVATALTPQAFAQTITQSNPQTATSGGAGGAGGAGANSPGGAGGAGGAITQHSCQNAALGTGAGAVTANPTQGAGPNC